jgi:DNA-binding response OmpR family regulator
MSSRYPTLFIMCDPYLAGIYGRKLELAGMDVEISEEFEDGYKRAMKIKPAVVILEVDCVTDPIQAIERFKSSPILQNCKIIIVGHRTEREFIKAIKEFADAYLIFGHFVPEEIISKINKLHQQYGKATQ